MRVHKIYTIKNNIIIILLLEKMNLLHLMCYYVEVTATSERPEKSSAESQKKTPSEGSLHRIYFNKTY